jgi:hypothetical protein
MKDPFALNLDEEDRSLLAAVLMENSDPPTKEEVEGALWDLSDRKFKREMSALTGHIRKASDEGKDELVKMLLIFRKALEGGHLASTADFTDAGCAQWRRGLEMMRSASEALKGSKRL